MARPDVSQPLATRGGATGEARPSRREHPIPVGLSHLEHEVISRAAEAMGLSRTAFVREAALYHARDILGVPTTSG